MTKGKCFHVFAAVRVITTGLSFELPIPITREVPILQSFFCLVLYRFIYRGKMTVRNDFFKS
ncbi:hypothetical protein J2X69_004433 [Algoriphagus sp. 4150]|nr:hypothetical protein [Algoriphagus sp. 4150]